MYKAWYNNNIHTQIIKLFNKKNIIYYLRLTKEFLFLIYNVIMIHPVLVIKVLNIECIY